VDAPGHRGFAEATNIGVAESSGELLLLLNNDTELEPEAIGQLVRVAQERPLRLGAVNAMTRRADLPAVIDSLGNTVGAAGYGSPCLAGFVDFGQFGRGRELFSASFTAVLIPRAAWDAVGALDERYGYYYEDVDWSLRARMGGLRIHPAPHAVVYHHGSASVGRAASDYKLRLVTRNRLVWAGKTLRLRNSVGFVRRYLREDYGNVRGSLGAGRPDEARAIIRAWLEAARMAPDVWRAREPLERWHLVPDAVLFAAAAAWMPLMDGPYPRLDGPSVRGHYLHVRAIAERVRRELD
jgi:GT2 family glycosyltransferase